MQRLTGIRACVFDAYGTLLDFEAAISRCDCVPEPQRSPLGALWRQRQMQYAWSRTIQGRYADFGAVTADALAFSLERLGLDSGLADALMQAYLAAPAYPDARPALETLRAAGYVTAILSNGTAAMLAQGLEAAGIADLFDMVVSADDVRAFKPHPSVYRYALDRLRLSAGEIGFLSSNGWDAYGAAAFGMRVVWCNRKGDPPERTPGQPEFEIGSLAELPPRLIGRES